MLRLLAQGSDWAATRCWDQYRDIWRSMSLSLRPVVTLTCIPGADLLCDTMLWPDSVHDAKG
jgi:hypothetical protein